MYDLARLAFETDSTRFDHADARRRRARPPLEIPGVNITDGYHKPFRTTGNPKRSVRNSRSSTSLHMKTPRRTSSPISRPCTRVRNRCSTRTMVLYGSNFGDAKRAYVFQHADDSRRRRASATASTSRSIFATAIIRCRISSSRCCSGWASRRRRFRVVDRHDGAGLDLA